MNDDSDRLDDDYFDVDPWTGKYDPVASNHVTLSRAAGICFTILFWILFAAAGFAIFAGIPRPVDAGEYSRSGKSPALVRVEQEVVGLMGQKMIQGGSGVIVSPSGWIVTAAHVVDHGTSAKCMIEGFDRPFTAAVVGRDKRSDVAILKAEADVPFPFASVASEPPPPGSQVWTEGFPAGNYAKMEGKVSNVQNFGSGPVGVLFNGADSVQFIQTDFRVQKGNSGGPLFDTNGDVVGIASTIPIGENNISSNFVGTAEIHSILIRCKATGWKKGSRKLPKLYVIVSKGCEHCHKFFSDFGSKGTATRSVELRSYLLARYRVQIVDFRNAKKIHKKYNIAGLPTFISASSSGKITGYSGPQWLIQELEKSESLEFKTSQVDFTADCAPDDGSEWFEDFEFDVQLMESGLPQPPQTATNRPQPSPPPEAFSQPQPYPVPQDIPQITPVPSPEPTPIAEESDGPDNPSLDQVRVIVLVKKELSGWMGWFAGIAEQKAEGPIEQKISSALGGKVSPEIVFQRKEADRYSSICAAADLDPEKLANVLIVAPAKYTGGASWIIERTEKYLKQIKESALKKIPVSAVFERVNKEKFETVKESIDEDYEESGSDGGLFATLFAAGAAEGGAMGWLFWWIKRKNAVVPTGGKP